MLAGLLLGPVNGALAVVVYIVLGLAGLPIFTQGGGPGYIFQPSFGYIIGFAVATYVTGRIANEKSRPDYRCLLVANFIGLFIVYAFGMVYYYVISNFVLNTPIGLWPLFLYCFLLAVPGDIVLCILPFFLKKRYPHACNHPGFKMPMWLVWVLSVFAAGVAAYLSYAALATLDATVWILIGVFAVVFVIYTYLRLRYLKKRGRDLIADLKAPYEPWEQREAECKAMDEAEKQ